MRAEHELIRRRRLGLNGVGDSAGALNLGYSDAQLEAVWSAGVNSLSYQQATIARQAAQLAIAGGWQPSSTAMANLQKWDAYAKKLGAVSKLTPQQFAQYQAQGSYDPATGQVSLTGAGGTLGKIPFVGTYLAKGAGLLGGLLGSGQQASAPMAPKQQQDGLLDTLLTPVGLVVTAAAAGLGGYAYYHGGGKKKGRRR